MVLNIHECYGKIKPFFIFFYICQENSPNDQRQPSGLKDFQLCPDGEIYEKAKKAGGENS